MVEGDYTGDPEDFDNQHPDVCDFCGGTGIDNMAPDDGTEDYDTCPYCGGLG